MRVMLTFDLVQRIAQRLQEILVGADELAVEREFDDSLRLVDGIDLPLVIRILQLMSR